MVTSLLSLPQELLEEVAMFIRYAVTRPVEAAAYPFSLLLVCRPLYAAAMPAVYCDIDESTMKPLAAEAAHNALRGRPDLATLVRRFVLRQYLFTKEGSLLGPKPPPIMFPNCAELRILIAHGASNGVDLGLSLLDVLGWVSACPALIHLCINALDDWDDRVLHAGAHWHSLDFDSIGVNVKIPTPLRKVILAYSILHEKAAQNFWSLLYPWVRELVLENVHMDSGEYFGGVAAVAP
jgi:hypothetical protein